MDKGDIDTGDENPNITAISYQTVSKKLTPKD
jgi:hypothetical protein